MAINGGNLLSFFWATVEPVLSGYPQGMAK